MRRNTLILIFVAWWLNQVISLLSFVLDISLCSFNVSRVRHIAAASLAAAYEDHRGDACPSQSGHRIDPDFLDTLSDEESRYYFRCARHPALWFTTRNSHFRRVAWT
jgi:hypothetical protein